MVRFCRSERNWVVAHQCPVLPLSLPSLGHSGARVCYASDRSHAAGFVCCCRARCTRLHFRTASFCTERSGHFDAFDQGISFFLPNMTWLQPPGYVHKMIADTWATKALQTTVSGRWAPASCAGAVRQSANVFERLRVMSLTPLCRRRARGRFSQESVLKMRKRSVCGPACTLFDWPSSAFPPTGMCTVARRRRHSSATTARWFTCALRQAPVAPW